MGEYRVGLVDDAVAARPKPEAEVDVLEVAEPERRIEASDRVERRAPGRQAGAGDVVDIAWKPVLRCVRVLSRSRA